MDLNNGTAQKQCHLKGETLIKANRRLSPTKPVKVNEMKSGSAVRTLRTLRQWTGMPGNPVWQPRLKAERLSHSIAVGELLDMRDWNQTMRT